MRQPTDRNRWTLRFFLRPGRFDRRVPVELPDLKGREEILKLHAKKIKVAEDVDYNKIARMASGASGAELANIVNEAALKSSQKSSCISDAGGFGRKYRSGNCRISKEKNAILTDREKLIVAYHEIGHALVAAKQTNSAPVQKITIVPRTSGGAWIYYAGRRRKPLSDESGRNGK